MLTRRHCEQGEAIHGPWLGAWFASLLRSSQGRANTYGGWYNMVFIANIENNAQVRISVRGST
jgi:hypothetical protein